MSCHLTSEVIVTDTSELVDLCVVWLSFMRRPKGELKPSHVANAIKQLARLQDFIYENAGGSGVKIIFVVTGVPPEWTPAPESIAHKSVYLEEAVALELGVAPELTKANSWKAAEFIATETMREDAQLRDSRRTSADSQASAIEIQTLLSRTSTLENISTCPALAENIEMRNVTLDAATTSSTKAAADIENNSGESRPKRRSTTGTHPFIFLYCEM